MFDRRLPARRTFPKVVPVCQFVGSIIPVKCFNSVRSAEENKFAVFSSRLSFEAYRRRLPEAIKRLIYLLSNQGAH